MERLDRRLAEAAAALARLDELVGKRERSMVERDSAILRLVFTYEAVWKACQKLLAALENVSTGSPNAAIRAARNLGWLTDEDARAAIKLGEERISRSICIVTRSVNRSSGTWPIMPGCSIVGSMP